MRTKPSGRSTEHSKARSVGVIVDVLFIFDPIWSGNFHEKTLRLDRLRRLRELLEAALLLRCSTVSGEWPSFESTRWRGVKGDVEHGKTASLGRNGNCDKNSGSRSNIGRLCHAKYSGARFTAVCCTTIWSRNSIRGHSSPRRGFQTIKTPT